MDTATGPSPYEDSPALIFLEITQACDLKCSHCRAEAIPRRHPAELTTQQIRDQLTAIGEETSCVVVFTGGDPFRRPDLPDLIDHCSNVGLKPALTPSTTPLLTQDRMAELKDAGLMMMALSLDGPDRTSQDKFRGEEGSFIHTLRGVRIAHELDIPLQINTTVCEQTYDSLERIGDIVSEINAFRWALFFLVRTGEGKNLTPIPPAETEKTFEFLHRWSEQNSPKVKTTNAPHFRRWKIRNTDAPRRPGIVDGDGIMFISHTGDVYPSGFLPVKTGNVKNTDALEIYRHSEAFQSIRDRELTGRCGLCEFKRECGGSRANAYAEHGSYLSEDPACTYEPKRYRLRQPSETHPREAD
ncbi:MAG: radical SAM protein [bacterium]